MAKYKLLLPKMGESVAEATVIRWLKNPGDYIEADEAVMEIATDKVDSDVPSPVSGKLIERLCKDNDVVQVGAVIAVIETAVPEDNKAPVPSAPVYNPYQEAGQPVEKTEYHLEVENQLVEAPVQQTVNIPYEELPAQVPYTDQLTHRNIVKTEAIDKGSLRFYSPLVRNIATQEGIGNDELDQIRGTGSDNRLTKDDLLIYIQNKRKKVNQGQGYPPGNFGTTNHVQEPVLNNNPLGNSTFKAPTPVYETTGHVEKPEPLPVIERPEIEKSNLGTPKKEPQENYVLSAGSISGGDEIIEMDRMRRLISEHMVMSKRTSAHVTSFVEADVTNLVLWRDRIKGSFEKREGEKITFTPIFIEAVVRSIKDFPMINISVNGTQIIKKKDINISMATALPNGNLIVPVIKKADDLNLTGLTKAVNDLANRARNNKLKPDDVQDGTFTITNVGSFGNVMGTPIINQPQVAILAVGAIRKKPAVIETLQGDMIGIRHMMFLSLSYDHRVVDGALGGMFVKRVADYLENWDTDREI